MTVKEAEEVTKILCNEIDSQNIPPVEAMWAALSLVGNIIAATDCPDCRENLTKIIDVGLPSIITQSMEHAAKLPQQPHAQWHGGPDAQWHRDHWEDIQ